MRRKILSVKFKALVWRDSAPMPIPGGREKTCKATEFQARPPQLRACFY